MKIYGDYHTHTIYSHGTGDIRDNVLSAVSSGLHDIAITDHGFSHVAYGVRRKKLGEMKAKIQSLREEFPNTGIFLGIESNINGLNGAIDIRDEEKELFDIIIAGYHKAILPNKFSDLFRYHYSGLHEKLFGYPTQKMRARSTDTYIKAIEKHPIDILAHINYGLGVEVKPVAEACAQFGTFLELNGKRINMNKDEFLSVLDTKVQFIIDSDAHSPERVGETSVIKNFLDGYDIENRIVNIKNRPNFRSRRGK